MKSPRFSSLSIAVDGRDETRIVRLHESDLLRSSRLASSVDRRRRCATKVAALRVEAALVDETARWPSACLRHSRDALGQPERAPRCGRAGRRRPSTSPLENVCTCAALPPLPEAGVGLGVNGERPPPERLEPLEQRDVAAADQPIVEEHVRRREDRRAVDVVLHLPVRVVADPHRPHAAIAGERVDDRLRRARRSPLMR